MSSNTQTKIANRQAKITHRVGRWVILSPFSFDFRCVESFSVADSEFVGIYCATIALRRIAWMSFCGRVLNELKIFRSPIAKLLSQLGLLLELFPAVYSLSKNDMIIWKPLDTISLVRIKKLKNANFSLKKCILSIKIKLYCFNI